MAIRFYDEAIVNKINSWLPKNNGRSIKVLSPDQTQRLFEIEADELNDKPIALPLIAISRDSSINIRRRTKQSMSFDGLMVNSRNNKTIQIDAIPISLSYQIDIYTKRYDEGDELLRELLFKLINNPQLVIELPYNKQKLKQVSSLIIHEDVEDTSSVPERLFPGQFTRWTLKCDVIGAYLFSLPVWDNIEVESEDIVINDN